MASKPEEVPPGVKQLVDAWGTTWYGIGGGDWVTNLVGQSRAYSTASILDWGPVTFDDPAKSREERTRGHGGPVIPGFTTKDSGAREEYASGMVRDVEQGKPRFDLMRPLGVPYRRQFLTRIAELMARGAEKYGDRNWEKGKGEAELARAKSSAARHFEQWMAGETDEDHAAAVFFNIQQHETLLYKMEVANASSTKDSDTGREEGSPRP